MDPARWQRLSRIVEDALNRPPSEREAFVADACPSPADREEVLALLAADGAAGTRLETFAPALDAFPDLSGVPLRPGTRIGAYVVEDEIGRGGMGIVYRARDERLGRTVAIKVLSPHLLRDSRARARLEREARAAALLMHESVAAVFALEEYAAQPCIVSEFVDGVTLRARLAQGPLPPGEAAALGARIARALAAAHARGIVHRDLKPENVMLTSAGGVKVLDFGIAHVDDESAGTATATGLVLGTPGYMAPEQLRGRHVDSRTDIFALGVTVYELLTGAAPFGREASPSVVAAVLERVPAEPMALKPDVPEALSAIVIRCLAKDPADRFATMDEVAAALEAAGRSPGLPRPAIPRSAGPVTSAMWWWRFHQIAATLAHAAMVVPAWHVMRLTQGLAGRATFYALLVLAAGTGVLRLHLWFVSQYGQESLEGELRRRGPALRWGSRAFGVLLAVAGLLVSLGDVTAAALAATCLACAAGSLVATEVIEPATTARALGRRQADRV